MYPVSRVRSFHGVPAALSQSQASGRGVFYKLSVNLKNLATALEPGPAYDAVMYLSNAMETGDARDVFSAVSHFLSEDCDVPAAQKLQLMTWRDLKDRTCLDLLAQFMGEADMNGLYRAMLSVVSEAERQRAVQ